MIILYGAEKIIRGQSPDYFLNQVRKERMVQI